MSKSHRKAPRRSKCETATIDADGSFRLNGWTRSWHTIDGRHATRLARIAGKRQIAAALADNDD